jgi:hypothetical protein
VSEELLEEFELDTAFHVLLFGVRMMGSVARVPRRGTTRTRFGAGGEHVMSAS